MKIEYSVNCFEFKTIKELEGYWTPQKYVELLELLDYPEVSSIAISELKEMCLMALTDNEPDESAKIVLSCIFKDRLNDGQLENLSHEIIDEKIWEEYADLSLHENFFNAGQILYEAFNGIFPNPEAVSFKIKVTAKRPEDLVVFEKDTEASLIRLLVKGMPENTLINRLFEEQIQGEEFTDAKNIIWQFTQKNVDGGKEFSLISSEYWFIDLKYADSFKAQLFVKQMTSH